jgi:hypothetical protein
VNNNGDPRIQEYSESAYRSLPLASGPWIVILDYPTNKMKTSINYNTPFNQSSYDLDDLLNVKWKFGDNSNLVTIPGYAKLDDASRTIVDEFMQGFPTYKYKGLAAPTDGSYKKESDLRKIVGDPTKETRTMFSENDTAELKKALSQFKPGTPQYEVLKQELDSRG